MTSDATPPVGAQDPEPHSRRAFLASAAAAGCTAVTLAVLPSQLARAAGAVPAAKEPAREVEYGFLVDATKCIGCGKCMMACQVENDVPDGQFRTWIERYVHYKDGRIEVDMVHEAPYSFAQKPPLDEEQVAKAYFVPKLCNHCHSTPCIQVCPVGASFITPEGTVLVDEKRCIGCSYCVQACPFGTRFINEETSAADKCTWCYHRTQKGLRPACVEVCPTGARSFGNSKDPDDPMTKRLVTERTDVLKSYLGTRPKTRYIGLSGEVT
jgi:Fe-S-cluster-containing dehydrogenase component